ncbi:MAG: glycosyltransferase family 2 protein [Lachnospiraceae bacterium]|nr:glycosyltransferase family 2 protein [Lachnospiraceae bacterium]
MLNIILATYNGRIYLKEQIESILNQDYQDFKLIIRDDDSMDGTADLVDTFEMMHPEKIRVIHDDKKAGSAAKNFFILMKEAADADYIMFADQDDFWEPWKVSKAVKRMEQAEEMCGKETPLLCHGDPLVADEKLHTIEKSMGKMQKLNYKRHEFNDFLVQNSVTGCTMIINKALNDMCTVMPDEAIMHDWWLALIASAYGRVFYLGEAGIRYRQHPSNTEGVKNLKSPAYIVKKAFDRKSLKESVEKTYAQAKAFQDVFGDTIDIEKAETLTMYIGMEKMGRLSKWKTMKDYHFKKSGFSRQSGYLFFG